jgi:cytochrome oxidase Cu insertion factor (SCO1/SenC/PrrC family)
MRSGIVPVEEQTQTRQQRLTRGLLWGAFGVVLVGVMALGVFRYQGTLRHQALEAELRPLGSVPDFSLLERSGRVVTNTDLQGKVWVVAFIFTRCVDECPLMSNHMARLQGAFAAAPDLFLVSITVDPEYDTPAVLSRYAESFGAHPQRWLFLTGDKATILRLAREGFHLGVVYPEESRQSWQQPRFSPVLQGLFAAARWFAPSVSWAHHPAHAPQKTPQAVLHSARLVLVDRQGQIRQYYDSRDADAWQRLQHHTRYLLQP